MAYTGFTTAELIEQVKANLGNRTDKTDAQIVDWINNSQMRLARTNNFREFHLTIQSYITVATLTGYKSVNQRPNITANLAASGGGLKAMESVRVSFGPDGGPYDRSYMLSYMGKRQFHRLLPNPESTLAMEGYPTVFTEENEQLLLYKIPNRDYLLEVGFWMWPLPLDADTPNTASGFDGKDDILIALATSMGFHSLGMQQQGIQYYAVANALIQDAIAQDEDKPSHVITGKGTSSSSGSLMGQPWNDPFVISTNS